MKDVVSFKGFDDNQAHSFIAKHTPEGKLWDRKFDEDSTLYKTLLSLAMFIRIVTGQIEQLASNVIIDSASELLTEWEASVSIPSLVPRRGTINDRREAIKRLLSRFSVYNLQDVSRTEDIYSTIEEYARILSGISIVIKTGNIFVPRTEFPLKFPVKFSALSSLTQFIFVIEVPCAVDGAGTNFPFDLPGTFGEEQVPDSLKLLLNAILRRVIPSFCAITYVCI